jgi:hypothetical protein
MKTFCYFGCGTEVDPNMRGTWRQIIGWEHKSPKSSSRRGGSDISMREPTGQYACDQCMMRVKSGLSPQQGALL